MKKILTLAVLVLSLLSLDATNLDTKEMKMQFSLSDVDGYAQFGVSAIEPKVESGSLVIDDISSSTLEGEEKDDELIEKVNLYPYWNMILSEDVDIEISATAFSGKDIENTKNFDWTGVIDFPENIDDEDAKVIIIGKDNGAVDYSSKILYSHISADGLKGVGYARMKITTENIAYYPAGDYQAELTMKLVRK